MVESAATSDLGPINDQASGHLARLILTLDAQLRIISLL